MQKLIKKPLGYDFTDNASQTNSGIGHFYQMKKNFIGIHFKIFIATTIWNGDSVGQNQQEI